MGINISKANMSCSLLLVLLASSEAHGCPTRLRTHQIPPIEWVIFDGSNGKELAQWSETYKDIGYRFGPIAEVIVSWERAEKYCASNGWNSTNNPGYDCPGVKANGPVLDAMRCHLGQRKVTARVGGHTPPSSPTSSTANVLNVGLDTRTPQVAGCPRYLDRSLVEWSHAGGHPESRAWVVRNVSNRTLKVTYFDGHSNSDTATLPPGAEDVANIPDGVPKFVVRDFAELMDFNRKHAVNREMQTKSLECSLNIKPR